MANKGWHHSDETKAAIAAKMREISRQDWWRVKIRKGVIESQRRINERVVQGDKYWHKLNRRKRGNLLTNSLAAYLRANWPVATISTNVPKDKGHGDYDILLKIGGFVANIECNNYSSRTFHPRPHLPKRIRNSHFDANAVFIAGGRSGSYYKDGMIRFAERLGLRVFSTRTNITPYKQHSAEVMRAYAEVLHYLRAMYRQWVATAGLADSGGSVSGRMMDDGVQT